MKRQDVDAEQLIEATRQWVREKSWQREHLERTLDYVVMLEPDASLAARLAGLTHDMERAFPEGSPRFEPERGWDDPLYNIAHQERSGRFVGDFLRDQGVPEALVREVVAIVVVHEFGGFPDADLVQAADSLSFLEVHTDLPGKWVQTGRTTVEQARGKILFSFDKIKLPQGRELGKPLLERALRIFEEDVAGMGRSEQEP